MSKRKPGISFKIEKTSPGQSSGNHLKGSPDGRREGGQKGAAFKRSGRCAEEVEGQEEGKPY